MILLDTDICIEILRGNEAVIEARDKSNDPVAISFMTVGELYYGATRSKNRVKNARIVEEFILSIQVINTDRAILKKFGELKAELYQHNQLLPDADILIAATSLIHCDKLITGNIKHFQRFQKLSIDNWIR